MKLLLLTVCVSLLSYVGSAQTPATQPSTSPVQAMSVQEGDEFFPYLYLSDIFLPGLDGEQPKANIEKYTRVIARNGKNILAAYNNRALAYVMTGRSDLALKDLETALASNPQPEDAAVLLNNQGYIFLKNGQFREAIANFNKCLEINPHDAHAFANRASVYQHTNQLGLAITDLDSAIEADPKQAALINNREGST